MPTMEEIYERHAERYQELVASEDYQNNLVAALHQIADWKDTTVLEAGVGTGRVTKAYIATVRTAICCDRSAHMLTRARRELADYAGKTEFIEADNLGLKNLGLEVDLCVEGWSFGHSVAACETSSDVRSVTGQLVSGMLANLRDGGAAILVETLGTGADSARAPTAQLGEFYSILETDYGFQRRTIRTDFRFATVATAARVLGFFFGPDMEMLVRERNSHIVPEWTGLWSRIP